MRIFKKKPRDVRLRAHSAVISNGQLALSGRVYTNLPETEIHLVIRKFREAGFVFEAPIALQALPLKKWDLRGLNYWRKFGSRTYAFTSRIEAPWADLPSSRYSIEVEFLWETINGELLQNKRGIRPAKEFADLLDTVGNNNDTIHLFSDDISKRLRIEFFHWGGSTLESLKVYGRKRISGESISCIIGERSNTAVDNGRWLFEALRDHDYGIDPTYVIERTNIGDYSLNQPNVVEYGSVEHLQKCIDSPIVAFTHNLSYIYPNVLEKIAPNEYREIKRFWLQHGVTAFKRSGIKVYKKTKAKFDHIAVSSPLEKKIFSDSFGYLTDEIAIVGFSRYDNLLKLAQAASREGRILVFPTWRGKMEALNANDFMLTDYFIEWTAAITELRKRTGMKIVFMPHPIFNHFKDLFAPYADEVHVSTDFQKEVVRASCLVTDYSSVCFDAIYAGKPVAFFHFDAEDYRFQRGAFIDLETQMPGPIAESAQELANNVSAFKDHGWNADGSDYQKLYFSNVDQNNSARIAEAIVAAVQPSSSG